MSEYMKAIHWPAFKKQENRWKRGIVLSKIWPG